VRVLLTGAGGDDFFTGDPSSPSDLLREGRVMAWSRAMVSPMLSDRARGLLRPVFGARPVRRPWIQRAFAARIGLEDRLRPRAALPFPTREQQGIHRAATSLIQVLGDEMEDRAAHAAGIAQRHPFYDRRVAEFGLALPASQRSDGGQIKIVIRRALVDYLPPVVASRADKAEFSPTYVEALEAFGGRQALARLRSEEAGWVDGRVIRQMYEDMIQLYSRGGDAYIAFTGPLWAVAALEVWLDAASAVSTTLDRASVDLNQGGVP
jgi:asparagine synthetase B (glutamine-hydrolysing)